MRFESYAQEWEDLILYVALRNVQNGFYIDIGANDPIDMSVTKFFYDRGWCGINIEPLRSKCCLLESQRSRDINLCVGIGNERGKMPLISAGMSSTFSGNVAEKNNMQNNHKHMKVMLTLEDIYGQYCGRNQQIHFCKIDVEGYEKNILEGVCNWDIYRPWIFVIESAEPGTDIPSYEKWQDILLENGYILAYATKINRYYVDERHEHLLDMFGLVDEFISSNDIVKMRMETVKNIM